MPKSRRQPAPTATLEPHIATELRLACLRIARRNRFESSLDVAPHQFGILARIESGCRTASEIAEHERVSAPTISKALAALEDAGWVSRTDDPADGRRQLIAITPAGRRIIAETRRARDEWMAQRLDALSEEDLAVIRAAVPVLERIASA